jgi:ribosomal protein S18 acetylase RimI-like enzyme
VVSSLTVEPARPDELADAFRLVFQHLATVDQETRLANALRLVRSGELEPRGIVVARSTIGLQGAMVCLPVPGASALVWPPQAVPGPATTEVEDALVRHCVAWLRQRGSRLAQALLVPEEADLGAPLKRNGFLHVTSLWYLRHDLDLPAKLWEAPERLTYQTCAQADPVRFRETLGRTYEGTQDCPEVNGLRSLEQILEGHRSQGAYDPARWWLALHGEKAVGVLLLTDVPEWGGWDVSYVGIVPEARRRGFGRELMSKALLEARAAEARHLTLSVDQRNRPAWELYRQLGFEPFDRREVFLAMWR